MRRILSIAALSLVAVSTAGAQASSQIRDGFTISLGLGGGSVGITCNGCDTSRESNPSIALSLGGALSSSLVLGGELNGWSKKKDGTTANVGFVTGYAQWYPATTNGFFVKGGLGFGSTSVEVSDPSFGSAKLESAGFAYQVGTGYDIRVGRNFSLTPYVGYMATSGAEAKVNGGSTGEKLNPNLFQVGLGFTWH